MQSPVWAPDTSNRLRRAITGCVRSVAGSADVEVVFANERPGLAGERVRLPELSKKPTAHELAVTRGLGDSMALRIACHDQKVHADHGAAGRRCACLVFDAVEQARVESIGALRMSGMADNMNAMHAEKYAKANFSGINRQEDAPIQEAVAMLVREKLTGEKPPAIGRQSARPLAPLHRCRRPVQDLDQPALGRSMTSRPSPG